MDFLFERQAMRLGPRKTAYITDGRATKVITASPTYIRIGYNKSRRGRGTKPSAMLYRTLQVSKNTRDSVHVSSAGKHA